MMKKAGNFISEKILPSDFLSDLEASKVKQPNLVVSRKITHGGIFFLKKKNSQCASIVFQVLMDEDRLIYFLKEIRVKFLSSINFLLFF